MGDERGRMKLGTYLPTGGEQMMGGANPRWDDVLAMARTAEEVGFDFAGVLDHLRENYWEGWSVLAGLAAATERIELLSYVIVYQLPQPGPAGEDRRDGR